MMIRLKNTSIQRFLLIYKYWLFQLVVFKIYTIIKTVCFNSLPWTSTRSSHREVFLEINLNHKTLKLCTSWVHWKNQCKSTIKKYALLCMNINILLTYLLKTSLTHFIALVIFYSPRNTPEKQRFSDVFAGHRRRSVPWNGLRVI